MRLLLTSHYFFIIPIRLIRYSLSIKPFHHSSLIMIMVRARALLSLLSSPPFTLDSFYNGHMSALDMTSAKTHIRQLALQQVRSMPDRIKNQCDAELLQHFLCSDEYRAARTIATYMSLPHEFDTHPLIEAALRDGKCVLIPHTLPHLPHHRMEFCIYDHNHLQRSRMSIIEPEEKNAAHHVVSPEDIDLIHVPAVAINSANYRIGYGKGYYDRYLHNYSGATISTIYRCQLADFSPESHDIPVHHVLYA